MFAGFDGVNLFALALEGRLGGFGGGGGPLSLPIELTMFPRKLILNKDGVDQ